MSKRKGLLITLEGIEGSGKSTHAALIEKALKKSGYRVLRAHEPGGTPFGESIRAILLNGKDNLSRETETLLYMASRAELVRNVIAPALKAGKAVLLDRWLDATIAYQGYGSGVSPVWIEAVAKEVVQGVEPKLTILLDLPVAEGLGRAKRRGKLDRIERRSLDFHNRVRKGYLALAKKHKRIHVVKSKDIESTQREIDKILFRVLKKSA